MNQIKIEQEKLRLHKRRLAYNLLSAHNMKPRHIRKYVDISARQLKRVMRLAKNGGLI